MKNGGFSVRLETLDDEISGNAVIRREIEFDDEDYPESLKCLSDAPEKLFVLGSAEILKEPCFSIVGSRKATPYGLFCAKHFASIATEKSLCVVSGGAIGCDQAAHKGALEKGGKTAVILGCGANIIYPKSAKKLYKEIVNSGGCLVSEFDWNFPPDRWTFNRRNRIIAGLSEATMIVEAAIPSGTFTTADYALGYGKEVFAIPGSIFAQNSKGANSLIQQGATPVIDDESFLELLENIYSEHLSVDDAHSAIIASIAGSPVMVDELAAILNMDIIDILKLVSELEGKMIISRYPDGRFGLSEHYMKMLTNR